MTNVRGRRAYASVFLIEEELAVFASSSSSKKITYSLGVLKRQDNLHNSAYPVEGFWYFASVSVLIRSSANSISNSGVNHFIDSKGDL